MFSKGDQVVERGSMSCVGTVVSGPKMHAGEAYFRVNFNGRIKNVVEEDLEPFAGEQDTRRVEEELRVIRVDVGDRGDRREQRQRQCPEHA